ncbi:Alpha/Beta hydrolase protein [Lipomyces arxii]|uniref:Alpha/Beta hydrolase protein n=1 Tax=Lipomyces arxii TaxID=56418 RepID=UPI0034CFE620
MVPKAVDEAKFGLFSLPNDPAVKIAYKFVDEPHTALPVIMLSNSLSSSYSVLWNEFVEHFRDSYSIILYDQRFTGDSPLVDGFDYYNKGLTFDELADDAIAVMDHLGIARIHAFIGLSMGATTAVVIKARYPNRIGKVIACGTGLRSPPADQDVFAPRVRTATDGPDGMKTLAPQTIDRWFPGAYGQKWLDEHSDRKAQFLEMLNGAKAEGLVACIRALQRYDLSESLEKIRSRGEGKDLLFVAGSMDGPLPTTAQTMAKMVDAKVEIVENCGHIVNVQNAGRFNDIVEIFLA